MRRGLDRKQRAFFATPEGKRALLERELRPTPATLIVVPTPLLEHWAEQLRRHVDLASIAFGGHAPAGGVQGGAGGGYGRGAVYIDGLGDLLDAPVPFPAVQIASSALASAGELAGFAIVVTTFERCGREQLKADVRTAAAWQGRSVESAWAANDSRRSSLMALRWLRLVVDEGHCLGGADATLADENANDFISSIAAERRWVLSGTPTVGADVRASLTQLHCLLRFLREPCYGLSPRSKWDRLVGAPFLAAGSAASEPLLSALRPVMVRHTKADLRLAPPRIHPEANVTMHWDKAVHSERQYVAGVFQRAAQHILHALAQPRAEAARALAAAAPRACAAPAHSARPVKAVVFSRFINDLEQVGHFMYEAEGDERVCQHYGDFRSTELSRFRNGATRVRHCPRCHYENEYSASGDKCTRTLVEVTYDPTPAVPAGTALGAAAGAALGAGDEFARTWPVEEERVYFRDASQPTGWRPWRPSDRHRWAQLAPHDKRVLVRGDSSVPGSSLPRPGGGDRICTLRGFGRCGSYFGPPRLTGRPAYEGCPPCWHERNVAYTDGPPLRNVPWQRKVTASQLEPTAPANMAV